MAASFSVNALQVEFESMLAMEHAGMVSMFKSMVDTELEGFLAASGSVFEAAVVEFFANTKVIAGNIVSLVTSRKLELSKEILLKLLGCQPRDGWVFGYSEAGAARDTTTGGPKVDTDTRIGEAYIDAGPEGHERTSLEQDEKVVGDNYNNDRQDRNLGCGTQTDQEGPDENVSNVAKGEQEKSTPDGLASHEGETTEIEDWVDKDERIEQDESSTQLEKGTTTNDRAIIVRSGPEQPTQQTMTYTGQDIFAPIQIQVINWATHIFPKIDPAEKGKGMLEVVARPNLVEEHCQLVLNTAWEYVSRTMAAFDEWMHFRTAELKEIERQHRDQRVLAGLPIVAPKASFVGDGANIATPQITLLEVHIGLSTGAASTQSAHPQTLAFDFSSQANQEQVQAQESDQRKEQIDEVVRSDVNIEGTADETGSIRLKLISTRLMTSKCAKRAVLWVDSRNNRVLVRVLLNLKILLETNQTL
ncbi:hypothetical protein F511_22168 [Dorcoceras hygrometricum]|uniref:Uncharacterized protein n=1 Tax=Dorcoceras hygrometricum TaxID=472368 RepID=A0A2Z7BXN3_9LAMI|nr:hypothetical protein F511_22168 [Dorcoceras hygrometricum]